MVEMLQWWTPIFEVPCMALANNDAEAVAMLSATNADFIALDAELAIKELHALTGVQCGGQDLVQ